MRGDETQTVPPVGTGGTGQSFTAGRQVTNGSAEKPFTPWVYGKYARKYYDAGWHGPLPIPRIPGHPKYTGKVIKVAGYTGWDGVDLSYADLQTFSELYPDDNVGIRMPDGFLGIDVDEYGDKHGGATLADLEAELGPLPATVRSTSRGAENICGIRLYRCPPGLAWVNGVPGIELVHWGHRYAMAWPSLHPEGRIYRWIDANGHVMTEIPSPESLPQLPEAYVHRLTTGPHIAQPALALTSSTAFAVLNDYLGADSDPCQQMARYVADTVAMITGGSGGSRHDTLNARVMALVRFAADGHPGVKPACKTVRDVFVTSVGPDRAGGTTEAAGEFRRSLVGATAKVEASPGLAAGTAGDPCDPRRLAAKAQAGAPVPPTPALADATPGEDVFFNARAELTHIAAFAHARMCSRWAVLGVVLARVVCSVPPNVVLPPIIGSDASLNLFAAIVGRSGSGKSAAMAAGTEAIRAGSFDAVPIGSGEGISRSYAYRAKGGELVWARRSVLFTAAEVDQMAALGGRQGATLNGQLREMFNGGALGFGYAAAEKRMILPEHAYRAALILGVQPGRSGALVDDSDGGTPQRFLWMPGVDADIPLAPGDAPAPRALAELVWPASPLPGELGPREALWVAPVAVDAIRSAAHQRATGTGDPLDGHSLLVRLKVAAALSILAGRKMVTADDWRLAGLVMAVSDATRTAMQKELAAGRSALTERLGRSDGHRQAFAQEARDERDGLRVTVLLQKRAAASALAGVPMTRAALSALRRTFTSADRPVFDRVCLDLFPGGLA